MSGPSRKKQKKASPVFKKTMFDLEAELKRKMIEQCKLDACVDSFLVDFHKVLTNPGWVFPRDLASVPVKNDGERDRLIGELKENINWLLPGYLDENANPLTDERLIGEFGDRWWKLSKCGAFRDNGHFDQSQRKSKGKGGQSKDNFVEHLVQMATKLQSLRLAEVEPAPAGPTPSLAKTALNGVYREFREAIKNQEASSSFACGGSIPIEKTSSSDVHIYWSTSHDSTARKLVLPLSENIAESSSEVLQQLAKDCTPASFGRGQEDILDPEYRKAGKLDPSQFVTSFQLPDYDIITNVESILLPSIKTKPNKIPELRKIRAEMYKLNIYSGPSGLFQKHVDTPRGGDQIGSLVVCLPSAFRGGDLVVRHGGKAVSFNWSDRSGSAIQWAAFYSDCEHEIKTITEGERITLTYNLYATEASVVSSKILDPQKFPLYTSLAGLLEQPAFMTQGGILGIYCSHAYPHTSPVAQKLLPNTLKESDLVMYSMLQSFGIEVAILPILTEDWHDSWDEDTASDYHKDYLQQGGDLEVCYKELTGIAQGDVKKVDDRWKTLLLSRQPRGLEHTRKYALENGLQVPGGSQFDGSERIGTRLHAYSTTDRGQEEDMNEVIDATWPNQMIPGVTWINDPAHEEMAFSYVAYGNEASIGTMYSYAAILAIIPPFDERQKGMTS